MRRAMRELEEERFRIKLPPTFIPAMKIVMSDIFMRERMASCETGEDCAFVFGFVSRDVKKLPAVLAAPYTQKFISELKHKVVTEYLREARQAATEFDEKKMLTALQAAYAFCEEHSTGVNVAYEAKRIYGDSRERRRLLSQGVIPSFGESGEDRGETKE